MARKYEIAFLIREGEAVDAAKERLKGYLTKVGATVDNESDMGVRKLAYEIIKERQKIRKAFYYFINFSADPEMLPAFETDLKYDESVIRHLLLVEK